MVGPARLLLRRLRPTLNRMGVDIVRHRPFESIFYPHIRRLGISLVLDVGANAGLYGNELRASGYTNRIVSFEPVAETFAKLKDAAGGDANWTVLHTGLGRAEGETQINVGAGSWTSSIRPIRDEVPLHYPLANIIRTERIRLTTLDLVYPKYVRQNDVVLLKLDVEGYEDEVLAGADEVLKKVAAIQIEMAITPVHAYDRLMLEQIVYLQQRGFRLLDLCPGFRDGDARLLQADGFFVRHDIDAVGTVMPLSAAAGEQ